jgi:mono/diheme cytochrome c family protein
MPGKWLSIITAALLALALASCAGAAELPAEISGEEISQTAPDLSGTVGADSTAADSQISSTPDPGAEGEAAAIDAASLFSQRCSGCHGTDRQGANGPALLPGVLTKDPAAYVNTITNGSGPMPAWGSRLSEDEINALVEFILSTAK